jgi:PEP-CTERM motif
MHSKFKKLIASAALTVAGMLSASAQTTYSADVNMGSPEYPGTLFSSAGVRAPVNTVVWFVASTDTQLGTFTGNTLTPDQLLGPDDTLVRQVKVDGGGGGFGPGYLSDTIANIPAANATRNIFLILFGNQTATGTPNLTPSGGETFGFAALGVRTVPGFGNADWSSSLDVLGNTHNITAIPEPSTYLLSAMGLLAAAGYRRFRK